MKIQRVNSIPKRILKKAKVNKPIEKEPVKKITPRKVPNYIGTAEDDYGNNVCQKIAYYPEDIEKMKSMTREEVIAYKNKLLGENKYYIDKNFDFHSDRLDAFMKRHGIDMNKYIVDKSKL